MAIGEGFDRIREALLPLLKILDPSKIRLVPLRAPQYHLGYILPPQPRDWTKRHPLCHV